MSGNGSSGDSDDGGGLTVLIHHKGSGKYAALSNDDFQHIQDSVTSDSVKDKLSDLATPKGS